LTYIACTSGLPYHMYFFSLDTCQSEICYTYLTMLPSIFQYLQ